MAFSPVYCDGAIDARRGLDFGRQLPAYVATHVVVDSARRHRGGTDSLHTRQSCRSSCPDNGAVARCLRVITQHTAHLWGGIRRLFRCLLAANREITPHATKALVQGRALFTRLVCYSGPRNTVLDSPHARQWHISNRSRYRYTVEHLVFDGLFCHFSRPLRPGPVADDDHDSSGAD